jgi:hypothetical protein
MSKEIYTDKSARGNIRKNTEEILTTLIAFGAFLGNIT